jgi:TonB family protein
MHKLIRASLAAVALHASLAVAQTTALPIPESAYLKWENLRMIVSPDSGELYLWVHLGELDSIGAAKYFATTVDPTAVGPWVASVRAFLGQKLSRNDTGAVRISPVLTGERSRIYVGRRRDHGNWSSERILVLERVGDRNPLLFAPKEKDLLRILDSIEAVSRRAPPPRQGPDPLAERFSPVTEPASMQPLHQLALYPPGEEVARREGVVLLRFVIGVDGKVDFSTMKVIHSTAPPYLESVLAGLRNYQFNPASFRGQLVRQQVVFPFTFFIKR